MQVQRRRKAHPVSIWAEQPCESTLHAPYLPHLSFVKIETSPGFQLRQRRLHAVNAKWRRHHLTSTHQIASLREIETSLPENAGRAIIFIQKRPYVRHFQRRLWPEAAPLRYQWRVRARLFAILVRNRLQVSQAKGRS